MNSKAFKFLSGLAIMLLLSVKLLGVHALIHAAEDTTIDKCELCEVVVKDVQESLGSELTTDFEFTAVTETQYIDQVIHFSRLYIATIFHFRSFLDLRQGFNYSSF